jgi:hypothetical protein
MPYRWRGVTPCEGVRGGGRYGVVVACVFNVTDKREANLLRRSSSATREAARSFTSATPIAHPWGPWTDLVPNRTLSL